MSSTAFPEDAMREKDARIAVLERQKQRQAEELTLLRSEIGASQIKHKEDIYWMRLECDSLRRDKEAVEDRMAELLRDMRELEAAQLDDPNELPVCLDAPYVLHLQSQLNKSMQTVGILDNQISMVKKSCDEVVKSLKEEIGDVMDDKCRMEMELMNQLATLDNDKRQAEVAMEENLKRKDEEISDLKMGIVRESDDDSAQDKEEQPTAEEQEQLLKRIETLQNDKEALAEQLMDSKQETSDKVTELEDTKTGLQLKIDTLENDLGVMRQEGAAEAVQVLDNLTADRQETLVSLERVALIWEKADDSIQSLEETIDQLKPSDDDEVGEDGERLLSTLETASLVHGQVKVALLLIELKLRNQLGSLKNDKLRLNETNGSVDPKLVEKMKEIQEEAVAALDQVEDSLSEQIKQLEKSSQKGDTSHLEESLENKSKEIKRIRSQHDRLQEENSRLRKQQEEQENRGTGSKHGKKLGVSRSVMERLQKEVLTVAQRVKDKNETIERLTSDVNEHKVREAALKKEMKRLLKRRA